MEVGIEDCLHIEFEYNKVEVRYHSPYWCYCSIYCKISPQGCDCRKNLLLVGTDHMELSIIRRETTPSPPNQYNESETITKFEIMDGAPVRGK